MPFLCVFSFERKFQICIQHALWSQEGLTPFIWEPIYVIEENWREFLNTGICIWHKTGFRTRGKLLAKFINKEYYSRSVIYKEFSINEEGTN